MANWMKGAVLLSSALLMATVARAESGKSECFFISDFDGWRAPDTKTIIIRVKLNQFYRLDLAAECAPLKAPEARLITRTRGPDTVCSPADWNLAVMELPPDGIKLPCVVRQMTKLSSREAAALPPKFKP